MLQKIPNFSSTGIQKLHYSPRFITIELRDSRLKGDMKFAAEKMCSTMPPAPIPGKEGKTMFNKFLSENPVINDNSRAMLCDLYKEKKLRYYVA